MWTLNSSLYPSVWLRLLWSGCRTPLYPGGSGGRRPVQSGGTGKGCTTLECARPPSSSSVPDSHPPSRDTTLTCGPPFPSRSVSLLPSGSWLPQTAIGQFGVGKSTVRAILMQVVRAISSLLLRRVVRLQDLDATMGRFAALGFPKCAELSTAHTSPSRPWNIKQPSL